ncbi:MAG: ribosome-associated translation inhibitor RaiA [Myxococcales bacterium]|nr:ribosome-associated translation inhibitor RaiA [Myxococcales bacterium]
MEKPVSINFHHLHATDDVRDLVQNKADKLMRHFPRITQVEVDVEVPHRHQAHHHKVQVRLLVHVPGGPIAVTQGHEHENMNAAVHDAFRAAHRELGDHHDAIRDRTRQAEGG